MTSLLSRDSITNSSKNLKLLAESYIRSSRFVSVILFYTLASCRLSSNVLRACDTSSPRWCACSTNCCADCLRISRSASCEHRCVDACRCRAGCVHAQYTNGQDREIRHIDCARLPANASQHNGAARFDIQPDGRVRQVCGVGWRDRCYVARGTGQAGYTVGERVRHGSDLAVLFNQRDARKDRLRISKHSVRC